MYTDGSATNSRGLCLLLRGAAIGCIAESLTVRLPIGGG